MKTYLDCFPCILRQALEAGRMATDDEIVHRRVLDAVMADLKKLSMHVTPPEIGQKMHRVIRDLTGNDDPYREVKHRYNEIALRMVPDLERIVDGSDDRLGTAVKLAIAGNIIDFGALGDRFDLEETIAQALEDDIGIDHLESFRTDLSHAQMLLYLGDNAGEIVFDKILIQQILREFDLKIIFVVKSKPIINDATIEDARSVGMDKLVEVIENGTDIPATVIHKTSREFQRLYSEADFVLAKGQGNYETLSEEHKSIYFLLKAKCSIVARDLVVEEGALVLAKSDGVYSERQV